MVVRGSRRCVRLMVTTSLVLALVAAACTEDGDRFTDRHPSTGESGGGYEATIRRTTDGVAHITGGTVADVAFGQGYAAGQDRPCDLVDQVLKVRGERAKWFGAGKDDENIDSDVAWRTIGIFDLASKDWKKFPKSAAKLVTAFVDGWNAHLAKAGADGVDGWCRGAKWLRPVQPVEMYAYARSIALLASGAQFTKYIPTAEPPGATGASSTTATPSTSVPEATTTTEGGERSAASASGALAAFSDATLASNAWAVGSARSADGGGLLLANPHFPWDGELRFWESHLTVPGKLDIYGVQLSDVPGIGIGFTKDFGWSHTVSAGHRFTAYKLTLVPGSPTSYRYGNEVRKMTPVRNRIEVLGADGKLSTVERTTWRSHYGPIIDFPGVGWTDSTTMTYRDANIDNDEFLEQYLEMMQAKSLDDLIDISERINAVPLFNTIAASSDGRAWYADTSATPNLSKAALDAYAALRKTDFLVKAAADNGVVLLDGSDPKFEWVDEPGARDPGLVPAKRQPQIERDDYVFNANDSFWLANPHQLLEGDYSAMHGDQDTARSPRTRENAVVLDDTSPNGPAGADGKFTLDELADASLLNEGYMARALRSAVVERCKGVNRPVEVEALDAGKDAPGLPAGRVDISKACDVLAAWDGRYNLDSVGAPLWRELMARFGYTNLITAGALWAEPFDPARPVETPGGLVAAPERGPDPLLVNLARAVQALDVAGLQPDVSLGDVQFALRNGKRIPIHGGNAFDGTTNVVDFAMSTTSSDPALVNLERERLLTGSTLSRLDDQTGYPVTFGTSFLLAVHFGTGAPQAKAFLTYGNTGDRSAADYTAVTERFSKKDWRDVAFTEQAIEAAQVGKTLTVKG